MLVLILNNCASFTSSTSTSNTGLVNGDVTNYQPPEASGNLWDSISDNFELDHNSSRTEVQTQIKWFMSHQEYLHRVAERASPYAYYVLEQVKSRNLPTEIALLPIVESAYNPFMYSNVGAAGLWQFMPGTASGFNLRQDWWYDGRRDIYASTKAALNYLKYLHHYFNGDWLLALAAYNCGEGTVNNAVQYNVRHGKPTDFWHLDLPQQTRSYVPKLLALAAIIDNPDDYPIDLPPIPDSPYLAVVTVGTQINLTRAAQYAGISIEELYTLNPGFKKWATDPDGPHQLIIPVNKVNQFKTALAAAPKNQNVSWKRYHVKIGDSLSRIATEHKTSTKLIETINDLNTKLLRAGQTLLVPIGINNLPRNLIDSVKHYMNIDQHLPGQKRHIVYWVKQGDSLEKIAKRYNVSVSEISFWNNFSSHIPIQVGQQLIIWKKRSHSSKHYSATQVRPYIIQHKVIAGDSLIDIAKKYHTRTADIRKANNLTNNIIHIGQKLVIPPSIRYYGSSSNKSYKTIRYKVKTGDSISKIAHHYGVSIASLKKWNGISANNVILLGQILVIHH